MYNIIMKNTIYQRVLLTLLEKTHGFECKVN